MIPIGSRSSRCRCRRFSGQQRLVIVVTAFTLIMIIGGTTDIPVVVVTSFQSPKVNSILTKTTRVDDDDNNKKTNNNNYILYRYSHKCIPLFDTLQPSQPFHGKDNNYDNNNDDNDENDVNFYNVADLNHFIRQKNSFKNSQPTAVTGEQPNHHLRHQYHKQQQRYDPLMGYTLEDLEAFAKSSSSRSTTRIIPKYKEDDTDTISVQSAKEVRNEDDGIFLDPNQYIQSSRYHTTMDGTISKTTINDNVDDDTTVSSSSMSELLLQQTITTTDSMEQTITDPRFTASIQGYVDTIMTEPNQFSTAVNRPSKSTPPDVVLTTRDDYTNNNMSSRKQQLQEQRQQSIQVDHLNFGHQTHDPYTKTNRNSHRAVNNDNDDINELEELWTTIRQLQSQQRTSSTDPTVVSVASEELHRRVFENEIGFINQSTIFLESLTDTNKTVLANMERRGRYYRTRQEQAIQSLNEQITEFETLLLLQSQNETQVSDDDNGTSVVALQRCRQCQCRLSEEEINNPSSKIDNGTTGSAGTNTDSICRVCYMERLVSNSKRNNNSRDQYRPRGNTSTTMAHTIRQVGDFQSATYNNNSRRYYKTTPTTRSTAVNSVPPSTLLRPRQVSVANEYDTSSKNESQMEATRISSARTETSLSSVQNDGRTIHALHHVSSNTQTMSGILHDNANDDDLDDNNYSNSDHSTMLMEETQNHIDVVKPASDVSESIYPWIEVMDPDTEEMFYWNEETEEMRWEL